MHRSCLMRLGMTAAVAVLISLLVSFTLTPMMSARLLLRSAAGRSQTHGAPGFFAWVQDRYVTLLRVCLHHRGWVALLALGVVHQPDAVTSADGGPCGATVQSSATCVLEFPATEGVRTVAFLRGGVQRQWTLSP